MPERVLPPKYKFLIEFGMRRTLTWKERLQALCGYNLAIHVKMWTEHKPGKFEPSMTLAMTETIRSTPVPTEESAPEQSNAAPSPSQGTVCNNHSPVASPSTAGIASKFGQKDRSGNNHAEVSDAKREQRHRHLEQRGPSGKASQPSDETTGIVPLVPRPVPTRAGGKV